MMPFGRAKPLNLMTLTHFQLFFQWLKAPKKDPKKYRELNRTPLSQSEGTPYEVFGPWVRWDKGPGPARFVASSRRNASRRHLGLEKVIT